MENLSIYFLKASSLTALFFIAYYVLLRKETFFKSNRWFLIAGLFTSALLPLVVYKKIVWIDPAPQMPLTQINVSPLQYTPQPIPAPPLEINWLYIALLAYGAGILFFAIRFAIDLYKVRKILNAKPVLKQGGFKLIDSVAIQSPFSFFNYIVYNSATLQSQELNSIISHEKVHSSQRHSLDILLAQLFCLAFWFNPIAWLYKRAISQNLEFIADAGAITFIEDKVAYQKTLLKITLKPECIAITNHFYQSLIKKRIVMINKQQSHRINSLKYGLVLPALGAFIFLFQIEVIAQEKEKLQATNSYTVNSSFSESIEITKTDTDRQLQAKAQVLINAFDKPTTIIISNVKRNKNQEIIAIKVVGKYKGQSKTYEVSDDKPITPFKVEIAGNGNGEFELNFITTAKQAFLNEPSVKAKSGTATITSFKNGDKDAAPADVLYIIDGIKQKPGSGLSEINPDDIEKIEVRKDTDNIVKLYGEDAKNGVILVTTKKSTTKPSGTFNGNKKFGSLYDPQAPSINMYTPISRMAANGIVERRYTVVTDGKQNDSVQAFKSGVKYVAYANSEIEDPATYVSYNVSAIKGKGTISRKKYSEMTADELTKAYESQETVLRGIKKLDKKIKASGDKEYSDNMEALKNAAQQAQKEIRQAQKDLKRRS
ncbi:M56 family metallopeptidase [Flavobacterium subsaxonicum]|uniref:M56 family metallopeptidase n=1 Tax=Flavobacterium subsaxonicum TaxID=426226 RepID=UPI00040FE04B|nr:M56 family metallopeptidase [Flavobacterium subsaxonicum]